MTKIYRASMTTTYYFNIKAESEEEALEWCQTHDLEDVRKATSAYDPEYSEAIEDRDEEDDGCYVDLT